MNADFTLAVFAKAPVPGQVKTRLRPAVDDEGAARLAAAFVRDTLGKAARLGPRVTVYYAGDRALLEPLAPPLVHWVAQGGGDLGARMARVPAPCLLLGADSPHLPLALLRAALAAIPGHDVVLGPAEDGGYFLLGLRAPQPVLFDGIAWSTEEVLAQTLAKAAALGLTVHQTPPWYDLDTPADLRRLARELAAVPPGSEDDCPATRAALKEILP
jgi:rSAM/selenodomain-associated transferase 1